MSVLSFLHRYSNQREKTSETNTFIGHIQAFFKSCGRCLGHLMGAERLKIDQKTEYFFISKGMELFF